MTKQFRRYDQVNKRIILDEKYLFAFTKYDGFSERLLKAELLVDYDYNLTTYISCNIPTSKHRYEKIEEIIDEKKSSKIISFLETLLDAEYLKLKASYWYETFTIDDIGGQQLLINFNSPTFNIHIVNGLPEEYFETLIEKQLFLFNEYLKKYFEEKYLSLVSS